MKVSRSHRKKLDARLLARLVDAARDEKLRVLLRLRAILGKTVDETPPSPKQFKTRTDYRKAIIAHRKEALARETGETRRQLQGLDVKVKGGKLGRHVVLDATPEQILKSVELPGVENAMLDRSIGLIDPSKRKAERGKDLRQIPGIGPVLARKLSGLGVDSLRKLARVSTTRLGRVADELGVARARIAKWVQSAKSLLD